jgi:hypothetical protein
MGTKMGFKAWKVSTKRRDDETTGKNDDSPGWGVQDGIAGRGGGVV